MQLGDVLDDLTLDVATGSIEITRIDIDSRECEFGSLFFTMAAAPDVARANALDALARGALCVVSATPLSIGAPVVTVPSSQPPACGPGRRSRPAGGLVAPARPQCFFQGAGRGPR